MTPQSLTSHAIPDLPFARKLGQGKVRDLYRLGEDLLLVTSDRVSAFDVVMAEGIPGKGQVLTALSAFWFEKLARVSSHHLLTADVDAMPEIPAEYRELLRGRVMRCRRARPLPVEWVVRGYLTGSGYRDYQESGEVSGLRLPAGLQHASAIEPPILTPSTKAEEGHDLPISFEEAKGLVGEAVAHKARDRALALYAAGLEHALARGIVIADTKFEFGLIENGDGGRQQLILIDECLTPDSSRFWPAAEVVEGGKPTSYDKQVLRDYLAALDWDKEPPPPTLPHEVIHKTAQTYQDILEKLTR